MQKIIETYHDKRIDMLKLIVNTRQQLLAWYMFLSDSDVFEKVRKDMTGDLLVVSPRKQ